MNSVAEAGLLLIIRAIICGFTPMKCTLVLAPCYVLAVLAILCYLYIKVEAH